MFDSSLLPSESEMIIDQDDYRTVETATVFRRMHCYRCDTTAIYKYRVQQIRRNPTLTMADGEEPSQFNIERWQAIPRFSEIPETVRCKHCQEVLGLHTECIF